MSASDNVTHDDSTEQPFGDAGTEKTATSDPRADSFAISTYIPGMWRGLKNTLRHILTVKPVTLAYPEVREEYPPGSRGEHYLKRDEQGRVRCVACYLCAAACPADCIHIEAAAAPPEWPDRDKYPARFEIDMLRCIYCGLCEEACPCDAIALSTVHCISSVTREEKIYDLDRLLAGGDALAELGASQFSTEGERRGRWERERDLPPLPEEEPAFLEDWSVDDGDRAASTVE